MPLSTPRASKTPLPKTSSTPRRRRRARSDAPRLVKPVIAEARSRTIDTLPLSAIIGEDSLAPYAWIILKGDEQLEAQFEVYKGGGANSGAPTRHGLRVMRIMNEHGKYPTVEFELYIPEYRKGGPKDDLDLARPLKKLRIGAEFSIKWGYRDAHTRWGLFRVMERDIQFAQGTALLTIKAQMGYKMSSTITADVFSTTFGDSAIDKLARLIDMPVNLSDTLSDEYQSLLTQESTAVSGGGSLSAAIYKEAQKQDLEMVYDPEQDALKLVTPFKLDLVSRGSKPVKMTYGFPSSPIQSLHVETKHPKKAGRSARSTKGVTRGLEGAVIDEKGGTITSIVRGTVRVAGQENVFLNYGYTVQGLPSLTQYLDVSAFANGPDNTIDPEKGLNLTASRVIENAEKVYPPAKGFIVSINSDLNQFAPPAISGYYHVIVQRKFQMPKNWVVVRDDLKVFNAAGRDTSLYASWANQSKITELTSEAIRGKSAFIIQAAPALYNGGLVYPVKVYGRDPAKVEGQAPKGGAKEETNPTSTTVTARPRGDLESAPEGEEFIDIKEDIRSDPDRFIRSELLRQRRKGLTLSPETEAKVKRFEAKERELFHRAQAKNQRLVKRNLGLETQLVLQARRPNATSRKQEQTEQNADSASADASTPRSDAKPLGVSSGKARPSRRLTLMTLRIRMKAGDWTLRTGKLIEIVDVYESINGIYYIHGEEHVIDDSGFHTEIICKKATSKQIAQYGTTRKVRKGTRKPNSGEKGDKAKAGGAKQGSSIEKPSDELNERLRNIRRGRQEQAATKQTLQRREVESLRVRKLDLL